MTDTIPLWLDFDPGHDDAFALLLALHHPFNLLGLSTVHGNASLPRTTHNALRLLTAYGRFRDIKVYAGADGPVHPDRPAMFAPGIHGESGIDGTELLPEPAEEIKVGGDVRPEEGGERVEGDAVEAMFKALTSLGKYDAATGAGGAWLVTTGTLSNAHNLLQRYPEVAEYLRGLSIMGGAFGNPGGNWRPHAEFNIVADPEAAKFVLRFPGLQGKLYLVPLDLTHTVVADEGVRTRLLNGDTRGGLRRMLFELLMFFAKTYADTFGMNDGPPLHDPCAVAVLLKDTKGWEGFWGEGRWVEVDVICEGEEEGRTVEKGPGGVWVPDRVDVRRFWDKILDCVEKSEKLSDAWGTLKE